MIEGMFLSYKMLQFPQIPDWPKHCDTAVMQIEYIGKIEDGDLFPTVICNELVCKIEIVDKQMLGYTVRKVTSISTEGCRRRRSISARHSA